MSSVPVINAVKVLPNFALSIEFTPPTDTAALGEFDSYEVTITSAEPVSSSTVENLIEFVGRDFSYLQRVADVNFGTVYNVVVTWVGSIDDGDSVAYEFTPAPLTSRPAIVRQILYELLADETLTVGDRTGYVHGNEWGEPLSLRAKKNVLPSEFPAVYVQPASTVSNETVSSLRDISVVEVVIELREAANDVEVATDTLGALQEVVRAALMTDSLKLRCQLGVVGHSITFAVSEIAEVDKGKDLFGMSITASVPVQFSAGTIVTE
jgi:hypothetical protein